MSGVCKKALSRIFARVISKGEKIFVNTESLLPYLLTSAIQEEFLYRPSGGFDPKFISGTIGNRWRFDLHSLVKR